eukprot:8039545-Lingulodinium_polyedra.AAC.1
MPARRPNTLNFLSVQRLLADGTIAEVLTCRRRERRLMLGPEALVTQAVPDLGKDAVPEPGL